jgi:GTP pyrophosphokinase
MQPVPASLEAIEAQVRAYNPDADLTGLDEAYDFAQGAHGGQSRKSGEPFINHPLEVALILAELHLDTATLKAALLHDVVEDSEVTLDEVRERFGDEVAELVDGVTKLGRIEFESLSEQQSNNLRKMLIAMAKDIRVILIKLADRLHNMRTLAALPAERRLDKARETMEIYAPLAHRLGISQVKWELEDLAFFYLEPVKFHQVSRMVAESRDQREAYAGQVIDHLRDELADVGITADISGRPKHLYSIYQKMVGKGKDFSEIHDLIALRVIVDSVKDVYGALGTVHSIWKPVPGRFKDYVAMPKFNMYQSLHTTVIGPSGRPLEIQIRTEDMHRTAEYGVAAHWRYKEGMRGDESFDERLAWLRQMLEWQTELKDPREFMEALKIDLFEEEVFVFTPKGDVISLKRGSTPIDFAYAIHTEVGNKTVGAKVNGSIVPLAYELQMGDRVDILTNKSAKPSRDWLNIVKTSSARSKIRSHFSKVSRVDDLQHGRDELSKVMRKHGLGIGSKAAEKAMDAVAEEMNYVKGEDLLAQIGAGKLSAKLVGTRLLKRLSKDGALPDSCRAQEEPEPVSRPVAPSRPSRSRPGGGVVVKGIDDVLVRLARCCNPVPGDEIIGYVTRGRGVSVHRRTCPNAGELLASPERILEVEWDSCTRATYQVEIMIEALDRMRLLQEVTMAIGESGVNILSSATTTHKDGIVDMRFLFEIGEMSRLDALLRDVRSVEGVFEARRMLPGEVTQRKARR